MDISSNKQALVLGASGGIGGEVARQLRDAGWRVQALKRGLDTVAEQRDGITWRRGDAMNRDDVLSAARGCQAIVHAVNPPGYRHWAQRVLPMVDNTIAAAIAAVVLGERLTSYHLVGGALTLAGVLLAELWRPREKPATAVSAR